MAETSARRNQQPAVVDGRLSFARIPEIVNIPNLLDTQIQSYMEFLQDDPNIEPEQRRHIGLQEAFRSVFPITSTSTPTTLEFVEYAFGEPKYSEQECMERGLTYAKPLKVKLQLIVREQNEETNEIDVKDIKEQSVFLGEMPIMTERGTFIINGDERVVVSQLHRSPGVSFSSSVHQNGRNLFSARVIPYRGAWVEFDVDINSVMNVSVDRKRKIPATTFLRCFNVGDDDQIAKEFFTLKTVKLDDYKKGSVKVSDAAEKYWGKEFIEDVYDPRSDKDKLIVARGSKVTKKSADALTAAGVKEVFLSVADGYDHIIGKRLGADVVDTSTGEVLADCWEQITTTLLLRFARAGITEIDILEIRDNENNIILNTLGKDKSNSTEDSLVEFFKRMRPGNPVNIQSARRLFDETFNNEKRYDLDEVGRHKINKRLGLDPKNSSRLLSDADVIGIMKLLVRYAQENYDGDDIDHLGNRRVRCVGELLKINVRNGLLDMEKHAKDRMAMADFENMLPQQLVNAKYLATAIKDFFTRSTFSQFMDQTNPLSELTNKRRLSALGPGGLSRDRAGFEVRDVHHTHYGRICPIETPEGPNIGLISSLSTYATINKHGFIESPYRKVKNGRVTSEIEFMPADDEDQHIIAQANAPLDEKSNFIEPTVLARQQGDFPKVEKDHVRYMDVSPKQLVSVSAALIPFLEHDDANRALMGSNMQRQAVPLMFTQAPRVGTGMERRCALDSKGCVVARNEGTVTRVTSTVIEVLNKRNKTDIYRLTKLKRSNQKTCITQKPIVDVGQVVAPGDVLADGPAIKNGELALGANLLAAFMPFGGYNFEDAIIVSERVVKEDVFTSIHIEEFEVDARDTKLGKEEITRDIPNVSEEMLLSKLDENGLIIIGSDVKPGDILVGKVTPKGETELTAEERLLRAIFGDKASDVRDASLKVPTGTYGTVVDVKVFSRKERTAKSDKDDKTRITVVEEDRDRALDEENREFREELTTVLSTIDKPIINFETNEVELKPGQRVSENAVEYVSRSLRTGMLPVEGAAGAQIKKLYQAHQARVQKIEEDSRNKTDRIKTGDELPTGVNKLVKVYIAVKRKLQVGDKMAGRHGNKGVVAKIMPVEEMPYLADGTQVDIVLNPLGVPSRMNVGQVLETHLGYAARALGLNVATPVFDGATEDQIRGLLRESREKKMKASGDKRSYDQLSPEELLLDVNHTGTVTLYDGATGEPFERAVTVGEMYILKLGHLVDDKMHARAIGPYSLVTQQPLGGKAQAGGQRFGEMEVWALEAYGAAYTLQELLTVKSDDVKGRSRIYESIIHGKNHLQPSVPESFNVLVKELQGLGLNLELLTEDKSAVDSSDDFALDSGSILASLGDDDFTSSFGASDDDDM